MNGNVARKKDNFIKLCVEMLLRLFQLDLLEELGLGPGFISISWLILILIE